MATTERIYGSNGLDFDEVTSDQRTDSVELAQDTKGLWRVTAVKVYASREDDPEGIGARIAALVASAQAPFAGHLAGEGGKAE